MKIKLLTIVGTILLGSNIAYAAESNFIEGDYAADTCIEPPNPPAKPEVLEFQEDIIQYNKEIEKYTTKRDDFLNCIEAYLINSKNDIKNITIKTIEANQKLKRKLK